ncbi:hypothetical protein RvY_00824 [Ramazzottius varieornatus]|uniref:RFX-type winged-helix domain-containing protein n=1 Tax=Ramazzottius varieornatus TaxID=947166 RepID=A0A1D1ULA9_RAMVA|nr:hypothetical protein RvY_00824 [Ramazzottius varieornatus]
MTGRTRRSKQATEVGASFEVRKRKKTLRDGKDLSVKKTCQPAELSSEEKIEDALESQTEADTSTIHLLKRDPSPPPPPAADEVDFGEDLPSDLQSIESDETPEKLGKDDPDYDGGESDADFHSEDEYEDDSEAEAASDAVDESMEEADGDDDDVGDWQRRARPQQRSSSSKRNADAQNGHAFNNGVGAELVPWLKKNFRLSYNPQAIMPRSLLYSKYQRFCAENNMAVVNSACLGKVLRRTFPGVDTRRLGRRGESKYHYIGLEMNPNRNKEGNSEAEDAAAVAALQQAIAAEKERPRRPPVDPIGRVTQVRSPVFRALAALDMEDRETVLLEVLNKLTMGIGAGHTSFVPLCLQREDGWSSKLPVREGGTEEERAAKIQKLGEFVVSFRIHLGVVAHCMINGAFVTLPAVFRNFWINREESIQIPSALSVTQGPAASIAALQDIVGPDVFTRFITDSYLILYGNVLENFAPNFQAAPGGAYFQLLNEFLIKLPKWTLSLINGVDSPIPPAIADMLYCGSLAFSLVLRKRVALLASFSRVDCLQSDQQKVDYVIKLFRRIAQLWPKFVRINLTEEEDRRAQRYIACSIDAMQHPPSLSSWQSWLNKSLRECLDAAESFSPKEIRVQANEKVLRDFLFLWMQICDILTERLQTNIRPLIGPPEPLYWLLEFLQRYVTCRVEEELVALAEDTSLNIVFTNALKERTQEGATNGQQPLGAVSLNVLVSNFGDCFRTGMPSKPFFFAGNAELQPFIPMPDDQKVPEVQPATRKEPSLLELLLR